MQVRHREGDENPFEIDLRGILDFQISSVSCALFSCLGSVLLAHRCLGGGGSPFLQGVTHHLVKFPGRHLERRDVESLEDRVRDVLSLYDEIAPTVTSSSADYRLWCLRTSTDHSVLREWLSERSILVEDEVTARRFCENDLGERSIFLEREPLQEAVIKEDAISIFHVGKDIRNRIIVADPEIENPRVGCQPPHTLRYEFSE